MEGYNATFSTSPRRGRVMLVSPLINRGPASIRKAKESSLKVRDAQLFNILPREGYNDWDTRTVQEASR